MGNIRLDGDDKALTAWLEAIIESADDAIISKTLGRRARGRILECPAKTATP
ncbi:MAG TPA: hypothetical protein VMZ26_03120 [Pyrinomonadaceae bacterium]|nr:hypothetical protein [Pyrinomonadaceae bacterium]